MPLHYAVGRRVYFSHVETPAARWVSRRMLSIVWVWLYSPSSSVLDDLDLCGDVEAASKNHSGSSGLRLVMGLSAFHQFDICRLFTGACSAPAPTKPPAEYPAAVGTKGFPCLWNTPADPNRCPDQIGVESASIAQTECSL